MDRELHRAQEKKTRRAPILDFSYVHSEMKPEVYHKCVAIERKSYPFYFGWNKRHETLLFCSHSQSLHFMKQSILTENKSMQNFLVACILPFPLLK